MSRLRAACILALALLSACTEDGPPQSVPAAVSLPPAPAGLDLRLSTYLEAAKSHQHNPWRDVAPLDPDGTITGYVEISKGDSTKWEFDIARNRREVDRLLPRELGGYPVNYGFLPRTISYDGDPADVLVLGPPLDGGALVKGRTVALMEMIDTGDLDSKVVISPIDRSGAALETLDARGRQHFERFFNTYKNHEGKATRITGWGDEAAALAFLKTTAAFFQGARR